MLKSNRLLPTRNEVLVQNVKHLQKRGVFAHTIKLILGEGA
jgi:hypothetical protein